MNTPQLVTAHDEREQCCVLDDSGARCTNKSEWWVGANGVDDYTHVCTSHLADVKQPQDSVVCLQDESIQALIKAAVAQERARCAQVARTFYGSNEAVSGWVRLRPKGEAIADQIERGPK
jgi:hypothetical protein